MLSVITITYNNLDGLIETYRSFSNLNYDDKQLIIVDGDSNDGTKDFLSTINDKKIITKSEKDNGIYDAMNKGLDIASGNWIVFMNAGDTFFNETCLDGLNFEVANDLYYANCKVKYNGFERIMNSVGSLTELWKGMFFSHQTVFLKSELFINNRFDLKYKFCADFNLIFKLFLEGKKFEYYNEIVAVIEAGGVSDNKRYKSTNEVFEINKMVNNKFKIYLYFPLKVTYSFVLVNFKKILPKKVLKYFLNLKYKSA